LRGKRKKEGEKREKRGKKLKSTAELADV